MKNINNRQKRKVLCVPCIVLLIIFILGTISLIGIGYYFHYFSFFPIDDKADDTKPDTELTEDDFLCVSEGKIVNRCGKTITLEGINLGGWLIQEYWMCPVQGNSAVEQWTNLESLNVLEERFGVQKTQELIKQYESNWITEWDIQNISAMGCNVIRVPFWYRNFMSTPEGAWLSENPDENPGFQRLDWLIEMAEKYGLYVVLDMHGCPGGQSTDHCSGSARKSELFTNIVYQDAMERLWIEIASRYKESPAVAAYDIMNEPQINGEIESVDEDPRNQLYDRMIKAIRKVDPNHILMLEGIWSLSALPDPNEAGWNNVVYEVHPYGITDTDSECEKYKQYNQSHDVPVYVGEFSDMNMLESCRKYGIHYTSWTYKGDKYMDETWFMYYGDRTISVNVYTDPYWLIETKWGKCLSTQYFVENNSILKFWNK